MPFSLLSISILSFLNLRKYFTSLIFQNDKTLTVIAKTIWFTIFNSVSQVLKIRFCISYFQLWVVSEETVQSRFFRIRSLHSQIFWYFFIVQGAAQGCCLNKVHFCSIPEAMLSQSSLNTLTCTLICYNQNYNQKSNQVCPFYHLPPTSLARGIVHSTLIHALFLCHSYMGNISVEMFTQLFEQRPFLI